MKLPWEPLFTIERSGQPEVTVHGLLSIWSGHQEIVSIGDTNVMLWSRSLLKPWQLLSFLPVLKRHYPTLRTQHLALMMSSHSGESWHMEFLKEILLLGGLDEELLKCPASYPMSAEMKYQLKANGIRPKSIYSPCSGKHSGFLMSIKAQGGDLANYLDPEASHFVPLKQVLAWALKKDPNTLKATTDGCRLPNYGFTANEIAQMYARMHVDPFAAEIAAVPDELQERLENWSQMRSLMRHHPHLIGGTDRLDSKLISGQMVNRDLAIVAKEGADGMLAVGIGPFDQFPLGLGILVKLASGYDLKYLEMVIAAVLEQMGLKSPDKEDPADKHIRTEFYFRVPEFQNA